MEKKQTTFALFFGNRGFMPAELIAGARRDMIKAVTDAGYNYIAMDEKATRYGAVETRDEGRLYHDWLKSHEGEYDGVILCMPIFIDVSVNEMQCCASPAQSSCQGQFQIYRQPRFGYSHHCRRLSFIRKTRMILTNHPGF